METLGTLALGLGAIVLFLLVILVWVNGKFSSLKSNKLFQRLLDILTKIILVCGALFVASIVWSAINQPSPFEKCMERAKGQVDPQAIDSIAEYCAQQND